MPPRKNDAGRWQCRFTTPPNAIGLRQRLYVVCRPEANTRASCNELVRQAIDRHVRGIGCSSITLEEFIEKRFLPEYSASRNLSRSWAKTLEYMLRAFVLPELGRTPVGAIDAPAVARLIGKLRNETRVDAEKARALAEQDKEQPALSTATVDGACKVLELVLSWAGKTSADPSLRFEALAHQYLTTRTDLSASTVARVYGYHLHRHLVPCLGPERWSAIDGIRVTKLRAELSSKRRPRATVPGALTRSGRPKKRWEVARDLRRTGKAELSGRRVSDQTLRHVVVALKSVLKWAWRSHDIPAVPEIPMPKVPQAKRSLPYTRDEARALVCAATTDEERAFFLMAFDAGTRKSEQLGLTWEQIDWEHSRILIDRQIYHGEPRQTKSGRSRVVPMSPGLATALRAIKHLRSPLVFCDAEGNATTESYWRPRFERAVARAQIRKVRWHDQRHAASTMRTDEGLSPFDLREYLGHADLKTTQNYVHPSLAKVRGLLDGPPDTDESKKAG